MSGLGRALLRQGRLEEARPPLERATTAAPSDLDATVALAELEEKQGNFAEAGRLLDQAEVIARAAGTDVDLQRAVLFDRTGDHQAALQLLEGRDDLTGAALLQRGRLRDRLGDYSGAWSDWESGKALLGARKGRKYDAAAVAAQAAAMADFFDQTNVTPAPVGEGLPQPIFILGFPRSGTTLTEQILARHSAIEAGGELPFGRELRELAMTLCGGASEFPSRLGAKPEWSVLLRDLYLARAEQYGLTGSRSAFFTDKMPSNDIWLPLLRLAFPQSPVILVRRHPLDVLTSVMAHDMTHGFNCGYRIEDAAAHLALMDRLVERYSVAGVGAAFTLSYEALVRNQREETERLMDALGLSMEEQQLRFHERVMVSPTPSYAQVKEPLNDRSIGRWRNYAGQLEPVLHILQEALVRGGYAG